MSHSDKHRINVTLTGAAFEMLEELSARTGKSMSEVIRDALVLERWAQDAIRDGASVLVVKDGETREMVLR